MFQNEATEFLGFFGRLSKRNFGYEDTAENLAKFYDLTLPESLKGAKITPAPKGPKKGKQSFVLSTLKYPHFSWALSFFAKTKCYLVCVEHGDHVHCVHICVTCLDGWPGPGCYLHGSWD